MNNTSSTDEEGDDAEKMRLAFEAFMLTGKKPGAGEKNDDETASMATSQSATSKSKKKKKKKKSPGGTPSPKPPMPPKVKVTSPSLPSHAKQSAMAKSDKKRYYQLLRSFNDKVQHTWLDIDNQMLDVLQNVVSIRGRLPLEWKLLQSSKKRNDSPEGDSGEEWKYHGFQGKPKEDSYAMHLRTDDIQLALSNDLVQHEKMLAGLRSLISDLAECHEALGRVVDTLWQFHLGCADVQEGIEGESTKEEEEMDHIVQSVTDAYQRHYKNCCLENMCSPNHINNSSV